MMIPEDIGGYNIDPGYLHLADFGFPAVFRVTGIVEFPADGKIRLAVQLHVVIGEADPVSLRIGSAQLQGRRIDIFWGNARLNDVCHI
ncbi:hypothetical protein D3C73_757740 [compost metagenome]